MNLFKEFPKTTTAEWLAKVEKDLKGKPLDSLNWEAEEDIILKPFYRKEDLPKNMDIPVHKSSNDWYIQEDIELPVGGSVAAKANKLALEALNMGINAPNFIIDEVLDQKMFFKLLKGIYLEMIYLNFGGLLTEGYPIEILKKWTALLKKEKLSPKKIKGALNVDPIGFYIENGEFYESQEADFESLANAISFANKRLPNVAVITAQAHFIHNQGSTIARELAILLAKGSEYLVQLEHLGVKAQVACQHLRFSVSVGNDFFMELAKIRALRLLWALVLKGFGVEETPQIHIHALTSAVAQTEDEYSNMIASTTQAMSATIAGADSLTVLPADMVFGSSNDFTKRIARNVQHILKHESYFDRVVDPAEGSYYIEKMTEEIADLAWLKFKKIEATGGLLALVG